MFVEKVIFDVVFVVVFFKICVYCLDGTEYPNQICPGKCNLKEVVRSDPSTPDKLKEQYFSEYGFGVLNYMKLDWASIGSVNEENLKEICECFFDSYYAKKPAPEGGKEKSLEKSSPPVHVGTNFHYCKEYFYSKLLKRCLRSPVVKCLVKSQVFYLAESVAFYFSRRVRNIFLFELHLEDWTKLKKPEDDDFVINYPAGDFKLFAPAVNLKQCYGGIDSVINI